MVRLLKYIMQVFYANEYSVKYTQTGANYIMALVVTTCYVFIAMMLSLFVLTAIFPGIYKYVLRFFDNTPILLTGLILFISIFILLRVTINEDSIRNSPFKQETIRKRVNVLIGLGVLMGVMICIVGLKFVPR
jgi:hypothetical protein